LSALTAAWLLPELAFVFMNHMLQHDIARIAIPVQTLCGAKHRPERFPPDRQRSFCGQLSLVELVDSLHFPLLESLCLEIGVDFTPLLGL
jgi:hypothetical protein